MLSTKYLIKGLQHLLKYNVVSLNVVEMLYSFWKYNCGICNMHKFLRILKYHLYLYFFMHDSKITMESRSSEPIEAVINSD